MAHGNTEGENPSADEREYARSQYREMMIEHVFIAELWKEAWFRRQKVIEVLRSEVDASGFDLLVECEGVQRHIQLKAMAKGARARKQNVNVNLAKRAGGCVIWIIFDGDETQGLAELEFLFFGGGPGERLPSLDEMKVGRHTRGAKSERPAIRELKKSAFDRVGSISELFTRLFGP